MVGLRHGQRGAGLRLELIHDITSGPLDLVVQSGDDDRQHLVSGDGGLQFHTYTHTYTWRPIKPVGWGLGVGGCGAPNPIKPVGPPIL